MLLCINGYPPCKVCMVTHEGLKNDWMSVSQYYYQRNRLRKSQVLRLYSYYNKNLGLHESLKKSSGKNSIGSETYASQESQADWVRTCSDIVKSATAGIVESALRQVTNSIIKSTSQHSTPNTQLPVPANLLFIAAAEGSPNAQDPL